eukprot:jgi/Botrbrau1/5445/Bobra.182_1s0047.2
MAGMQFWSSGEMRTPEDVFDDFEIRRRGILRALTQDVDEFYNQCDPERENLCLYGTPQGTWLVDLPAEEVPPELPEPALGINFARNGMQKKDWLALVAVHSDTWLISVAFYNGARLNKEGRDKLFQLINELPTCYEIVSGKSKDVQKMKKRPVPGPGPPPQAYPKRPAAMGPRGNRRLSEDDEDADEEDEQDDDDEADGYADGEGEPCPNCGRVYRQGEFWIACDFCETWYDGMCVKMTPQKAQKVGKWKCPACLDRGNGR